MRLLLQALILTFLLPSPVLAQHDQLAERWEPTRGWISEEESNHMLNQRAFDAQVEYRRSLQLERRFNDIEMEQQRQRNYYNGQN